MKESKILFTGGSGFIGSAVCSKLFQLGNKVVSFDNFSRVSRKKQEQEIATYNGDVRDVLYLQNVVDIFGPFDQLWHFAYINGTETFYSSPDIVLEVGVKGIINTLDIALKNNIKDYVLCSTSEVYCEPETIPTTEQERLIIPDVMNPRFSYSGGKIISELMTIHYGAKRGLNTKIFRPHNIYGPNMGTDHVIPQIIKKILLPDNPKYQDNKLIINIQGSGKETRAFCYIDDAVDQMILAKNYNEIYNIGMQDEITIEQLINMIAEILSVKIRIISGEKQNGGTNRRCPDMTKMKNIGYTSNHKLYDGLKKTIEWYKNYYLGKI